MHESTSCDVYLHVTSRAIIEDCSAIRVAPYNYLYEQLSDHFEVRHADASATAAALCVCVVGVCVVGVRVRVRAYCQLSVRFGVAHLTLGQMWRHPVQSFQTSLSFL